MSTMNYAQIAALLRQLAELFDSPAESPSEPQAPEKKLTLFDVRSALADLSRQGKTSQVHDLIRDFGATKLSEIPEDRFADLLAAAKELANAQ